MFHKYFRSFYLEGTQVGVDWEDVDQLQGRKYICSGKQALSIILYHNVDDDFVNNVLEEALNNIMPARRAISCIRWNDVCDYDKGFQPNAQTLF